MESAGAEIAGDVVDNLAFVAALRAALSRAAIVPTLTATPADHLLEGLVRAAAAAIPSPAGSLLLVDPVAKVLTFDVVIGQTAAKLVDLTLPLGRGLAGLLAASG
jgi:hypothetical protein